VSFGGSEAPSGAPCVVQGGDDGKQRGGIEGHGAEHDKWCGGVDLAEKDGEQRQDLGAGTRFAVDAGPEITHAEADVEERGDDQNAQVAAKDQDGDPPGHQPLVHENQKKGAEQELVGDGIEVLADLGLLLKEPRGQAIEPVAEACDHEEAERSSVVGLEHSDNKEGY
jgi:hypothetical protein